MSSHSQYIKKYFLLSAVFLFVGLQLSFSQSKEEKELLKNADKLFKNESYVQAGKIYAQLLGADNENPEYNYKYGACLLQTSKKKTDALKYLKFATSKSTEINVAHYYLARAYHVSYQFDLAIKNYKDFKRTLKPKQLKNYPIDQLIVECEKGSEIIRDFKQIKVLRSKKMKRSQFFRAYKLGKLNRKILVKPAAFSTKEDEQANSKDPMLVVHGPEEDVIVFAAYKMNSSETLDKDIYMATKDEEGNWGSFNSAGPNVNSDYDEDFPYLHPNGKDLYFASKGHDGLGGYDLYRSRLNASTGEWGVPENLGFSINSPFDDILYIVDQDEKVAFFSSNRANKAGELTVYKILPQKRNNNFILVKGEVDIVGSRNNKTKINIKSESTGEFVGRYKSQKKSGKFVFPLAESESYTIEFVYADSVKQKVKITTPLKKDKDMVFQNVEIKLPEGGGSPQIAMTENVQFVPTDKDRTDAYNSLASLGKNQIKDVNFNPAPVKKAPTATMTVMDEGKAPEGPSTLVEEAQAELAAIQDEQTEIAMEVEAAYDMAEVNDVEASRIADEIDDLRSSGGSRTQIDRKIVERNEKLEDAVEAIKYAKNREENLKIKNREEQMVSAYVDALETAMNSDNDAAAIEKLESYQSEMAKVEEELKQVNSTDNLAELKKKYNEKKNEKTDIGIKKEQVASNIELIDEEIKLLGEQIENTRKKSIKEEFNLQIEELKEDRIAKEAELVKVTKSYEEVSEEFNDLSDDLSLYTAIAKNAKAGVGQSDSPLKTEEEKRDLIYKVGGNVQRYNAKLPAEDYAIVGVSASTINDSEVSTAYANLESGTSSDNPSSLSSSTASTSSSETSSGSISGSSNYSSSDSSSNPALSSSSSTSTSSTSSPSSELTESSDNSDGSSYTGTSSNDTNDTFAYNSDETQSGSNSGEGDSSEELRYSGDLDTDLSLSTSSASTNRKTRRDEDIPFSKTYVDDESTQELSILNVADLQGEDREEYAEKVFNYPSPEEVNSSSSAVSTLENDAYSELTEALALQQIVEAKKDAYRNSKSKASKDDIEVEILGLESKILRLKESSASKLNKAADQKFLGLKEANDLALFVDQNSVPSEIKEQNEVVEKLWNKAESIEKTIAITDDRRDQDLLRSDLLIVKNQAIKEQKRLSEQVSAAGLEVANIADTGKANGVELNSDINSSSSASNTIYSDDDSPSASSTSSVSSESSSSSTSSSIVSSSSGTASYNSDVSGTNSGNADTGSSEYSGEVDNSSATDYAGIEDDLESETGSEEEVRTKYSKKSENLKILAAQESDPQERQKLLEKAAIYELAGSEEKMIDFGFESQEEFTDYEENVTFVSAAKKGMNKNSVAEQAYKEEEKATQLYLKAQKMLENANTEKDPLKKISKFNEARETIAFAKLKQKEAMKTYQSSKSYPEDPSYSNRSFEIDNEAMLASIELNEGGINIAESIATADNGGNENNISFESSSSSATASSLNNTSAGTASKPAGGDADSFTNASSSGDNEFNSSSGITNEVESSAISVDGSFNPEVSIIDGGGAVAGSVSRRDDATTSEAPYDPMDVYRKLIKEAEIIEAREEERNKLIADLKDQALQNRSTSEDALAQTQSMTEEAAIARKLAEANAFREQAENQEVQAKNEEYYQENNLNEAAAKRQEAALILGQVNDGTIDVAALQKDYPITRINVDIEEGRGTYAVNTVAVKEGFKVIPTARYNSRTKIPVDEAMPSGILYKVQVGAFRNKINPAIFNGITPLTGSRGPNGIIRYQAGLFKSFKAADMAKGRIKNLGYRDAFVVVYKDGEAITLDEARAIQSGLNDAQKNAYTASEIAEVNALKKLGIREEEASATGRGILSPIEEFEQIGRGGPRAGRDENVSFNGQAAPATSINNRSGKYYTVQVGVYRTERTEAQMGYLSPLAKFVGPNGYIRYSTGVYDNFEEANRRKNEVRSSTAFSDAYVVAYENGRRIDVDQARSSSSNNSSSNKNTNSSSNQPSPVSTTGGVTYKVQVGAYREIVDISGDTPLAKLNSFGLDYRRAGNGLFIFTVGSYDTQASAEALKDEVRELGFSDAFVVALNNGVRISLQEAAELSNN